MLCVILDLIYCTLCAWAILAQWAGMSSRSQSLGLETILRRFSVSSQTKCSMSRSHLSLGTVRLLSLLGLGISSWVSDHFVSLRRFVHSRHASILTSMPYLCSWAATSIWIPHSEPVLQCACYIVNVNLWKMALANTSYFIFASCSK